MLLVLLANGQGTRIAPISHGKPKALLRIGRESLVSRHIRIAHGSGVVDRVLCVVAPGKIDAFAAQIKQEVGQEMSSMVSYLEDAPTAYAECVARVYPQLKESLFFAVDADNLFIEAEQIAFFRHAPSRIESKARLVVGAVTYGVSNAHPRIPSRLLVSENLSPTPHGPFVRGIGSYLWSAEAAQFAARYASLGGRSLRELIQQLCSRGEIRALPFTRAMNVNTPDEYQEAQTFVASEAG